MGERPSRIVVRLNPYADCELGAANLQAAFDDDYYMLETLHVGEELWAIMSDYCLIADG